MSIKRIFAVSGLCLLAAVSGCGGGADSGSGGTASVESAPPPAAAPESSETTPAEPVAEVKEGWGHVKGRFVYDGTPPSANPLQITKDQEVCGKHQLVDESLVVNAENGGLANVAVFLYTRRGETLPTPHESYAEAAESQIELDNDKCRFEPRVCLLRTSQTLLVKNSDPVGHNTKIDTLANPAFNQTIPASSELAQQFSAAERRPASVACSIHPWMQGWLLVQESPYFAVTNANGDFEISNLPAGTWTLQVWHEKNPSIDKVNVNGEAKTWSKGRFEVTVNGDATTDLGEIKVGSALFQ